MSEDECETPLSAEVVGKIISDFVSETVHNIQDKDHQKRAQELGALLEQSWKDFSAMYTYDDESSDDGDHDGPSPKKQKTEE